MRREFLFITITCTCFISSYTAHVHNHHHAAHGGSKERVEDGSPHFDHEAVLGSKKAAKEFDTLSPEESKKRLAQLVTRGGMDANGDGYVDMIELKDWIVKSFARLAREDGTERFLEEDENKDNFVDWSEHLNYAFDIDLDVDLNDLTDPENRQLMEEDRALWKAADADHDGKLNQQEFIHFNSPEEFAEMKEVLFELTMIRRDKNRDGFIDLHEFMVDEKGLLPDPQTQVYVSERDRFINEYDSNKDGKLCRSEVLHWIVPDNLDMAEQEAENLFIPTDKNDDNRLSVDEIVDQYNLFVGSEATSFGERLKNIHDEL